MSDLDLSLRAPTVRRTADDIAGYYTVAIGLLCELSAHIRPSLQREEHLDLVEQAATDWCRSHPGWTVRRLPYKVELVAPSLVA